jgi:hypothetical protein
VTGKRSEAFFICFGSGSRSGREPFYSQTDRISSEIPETQPSGFVPGMTIQIN